LLLSFFAASAKGADYNWITESGYWSEGANWDTGTVPGPDSTITIPFGSSATILSETTFPENSTINVYGDLSIESAVTIPATSTLRIAYSETNDHALYINSFLTNDGTFINNHKVYISGTFTNNATATITNYFRNDGQIYNNGTLDMGNNGYLLSNGRLENNGDIILGLVVHTNGPIVLNEGGTMDTSNAVVYIFSFGSETSLPFGYSYKELILLIGNFVLPQSLTVTDALTLSSDADLTLGGDVTMGSNGSLAVNSGSTLNFAGHSIAIGDGGSVSNSGELVLNGGYLGKSPGNLQITNQNFDIAPTVTVPADQVYLSISDPGVNLLSDEQEAVEGVEISCTNDSESVNLTETGVTTGVFRYSTGLPAAVYDGSATENDGTLECSNGGTITASYVNPYHSDYHKTATATVAAAPGAPTNFSGTAASTSSITWSWTRPNSGETGYKIYSQAGQLIATVTGATNTSYVESDLTSGTSYTRKVAAFNAVGNSEFTTTATVAVPSPPAAPSSFAGTAISSGSITWTWTDNSSDETGFRLLDSAENVLATISANSTSYTETGLVPSRSYVRKIVSYTSYGNSTASNSATVSTLAALSSPQLNSPANETYVTTLTPVFTFKRSDGNGSYDIVFNSGTGSEKVVAIGPLPQYANGSNSDVEYSSDGSIITVILKNSTILVNGRNTWFARITDTGGNSSDSSERSFVVDTSVPVIGKLLLAESVVIDGKLGTRNFSPRFSITAEDNDDLAEIELRIETQIGLFKREIYSETTKLTNNLTVFSVVPKVRLEPGTYTLRAIIRDRAGNTKENKISFAVFAENKQSLVTQSKTIKEVAQEIEKGGTPSKVPEGMQLRNLQEEEASRRQKQAENMNLFLTKFISQSKIEKFDALLAQWRAKSRQTALSFMYVVRNRTVAVLKPLTSKRSVYAMKLRVEKLLDQGKKNRLELAMANETKYERITGSFNSVIARFHKAALLAYEVISDKTKKDFVITNVTIDSLAPTQVVVSWKTNRMSRGKINYGPSISYGKERFIESYSDNQRLVLDDLQPGTKYYFEILAWDKDGRQTYDAYYGFETPRE